MCRVLLDNDILAKGIAYQFVDELLAVLETPAHELGILGTLVYAISPRRLRTAPDGGESASERLRIFVEKVRILEPTETELRLATLLEEAAQQAESDLDVGESQLFAIAVFREVQYVCTGDKRAISSLETLRQQLNELSSLDRRIIPLEELVRALVGAFGHEYARERICAARGTDRALEVCFQCHNQNGDFAETNAGLKSYLSKLKEVAPTVCGELKAYS